jgi:hypothetical protein
MLTCLVTGIWELRQLNDRQIQPRHGKTYWLNSVLYSKAMLTRNARITIAEGVFLKLNYYKKPTRSYTEEIRYQKNIKFDLYWGST